MTAPCAVCFTTLKTRLLPVAAGALLVCAAAFAPCAAHAGFGQQDPDTSQLMARIGQLENQVQTLSRAVYRGQIQPAGAQASGADAGASSPAGTLMSNFQDRLGQIEQQQRSLTGQIEQMTYNIQQLQQKLDKMQADTDMRLQQLEGGHGGAVARGGSYQAPVSPPSSASSSSSGGGKLLGTMTASGGADSAETLYQSAFSDLRDGHYDSASAKFKQFMGAYPKHPLASNAQYWLGETYYVQGDYHEAARLFAQDYQNYPQGGKASASLLKLGMALSKLGKKGDACLSFAQLKKEFPNTAETRAAATDMKNLNCN